MFDCDVTDSRGEGVHGPGVIGGAGQGRVLDRADRGLIEPPSVGQLPPGGRAQRRGRVEGRREVLRQRRDALDRRARDRVGEGQARGVQELALEPQLARRARTRGRRPRGGRSPAGARGSGGCARSPGARAAGSGAAAPRSSVKWVTAARGSSVSVDIRVRTRRSRPIGASIVPARAGGRPVDQREVLAGDLARLQRRLERPVHVLGLARRRAARWCPCPAGARSRRGTGPRRPAARPSSAWASVPSRLPARRVHDHAGGLVDDEQVLVLVGDAEGGGRARRRPRGPARRGRPPRRRRSPRRPASRWRLATTAPSTRTAPASIRRCGARPRAQRPGQEGVEPGARGRRAQPAGARGRSERSTT